MPPPPKGGVDRQAHEAIGGAVGGKQTEQDNWKPRRGTAQASCGRVCCDRDNPWVDDCPTT